jgi:hypothetical protein
VNGEFELLGEFGGSFVAGVNGQRDISSSSNNRGFNSNVEDSILTNFGSSI